MRYAKEFCWIGSLLKRDRSDCLVWVLLRESEGKGKVCRAPVFCRQSKAITLLEEYLYEAANGIIEATQRKVDVSGLDLVQEVSDDLRIHVRWILGGRQTPRGCLHFHQIRCEYGEREFERPCSSEVVLYDGRVPGGLALTLGGSVNLWAECLASLEGWQEVNGITP